MGPFPEQELARAVPGVVLTALYDQMAPQLCPFEIAKFAVFHAPLFPTSFPLLDITMGPIRNHLPLFLYYIKLVPSLPPISHLSHGAFP